jgi:glycosyltransferase involved in cell wall biosynthesis
MEQIKILFGLSQLGRGGLELQVLELCKGLSKDKFLIYCLPLWPIYDLEEEFVKTGVQIIKIHKKASFDLSILLRLIKFLKREKIDIVHTWIFTSNTWTRTAAILNNIPVIIASERSVDTWKKFPHKIVDRLLSKKTDLIISNSKAVYEFVISEGISANKCNIIYNGVDIEKANNNNKSPNIIKDEINIPLDKIIIGIVANFNPQKDYNNFVHAANLILKNRDDVHFLTVGIGPELNSILELTINFRINNRFTFLGSRNDIPNVLSVMDIFTLTSTREGFSNAILEAMAVGLPIVATDVGGNAEAVVDGETGFIVPPNDPEELALALIKLIESPKLRKNFGEGGKRRTKLHFDSTTMVETYSKLYLDLINRKYE